MEENQGREEEGAFPAAKRGEVAEDCGSEREGTTGQPEQPGGEHAGISQGIGAPGNVGDGIGENGVDCKEGGDEEGKKAIGGDLFQKEREEDDAEEVEKEVGEVVAGRIKPP